MGETRGRGSGYIQRVSGKGMGGGEGWGGTL